jgi:hypothetical protein
MPAYGTDRTSLVLNFDGTFADEGQFAHGVTPGAGATISSAKSKFGGQSLLLDGGATSVLTIPSHASLQFGVADFTIAAWIWPTAVSSTQAVVSKWGDSGYELSWWFGLDASARLAFYYSTNGGSGNFGISSAASAVPAGAWSYVTVSRNGGFVRLTVNGAVVHTSAFDSNIAQTAGPVRVGASEQGGGMVGRLNGHVDGVIVTKGVGLYPDAFPVPTAAPSGPTYLMIEPREVPVSERIRSAAVAPFTATALVPLEADSGFGRIVGTVKEDKLPVDLPLRRRVRLHDDATGRAVREVWSSAATGAYEFPRLDPAKRYSAIAYDRERNYRAVIADNLTPEPTP